MLKYLENSIQAAEKEKSAKQRSIAYKTNVLPAMTLLRKDVDALENLVSADYWPIPTYGDLLFEV
jgi:glutamine synthetase